MIQDGQLLNYVSGSWQRFRTTNFLDVRNPASAETVVRVPLSARDEVDVELWRGIENVEVACCMPGLMQGYNSEGIARHRRIHDPAARRRRSVITPFNFPGIILLAVVDILVEWNVVRID